MPVSVVDVVEVGVPGLDSDDAFCASWSRFAGSCQVVARGFVGPRRSRRCVPLEVAASPVVTTAYDDLVDNWPDELAAEADLVADGFLGALERRSAAAASALAATDATVDRSIASAWFAGLALAIRRRPTSWSTCRTSHRRRRRSSCGFRSQRTEFARDPSMVIEVATPLTDSYLEIACPDQGTLTGQEIDGAVIARARRRFVKSLGRRRRSLVHLHP